jgi:hypothetical protein
MTRSIAMFMLLLVLLLPRPARASRAADEALAAEISAVMAANETELLAVQARLTFLRDRMESSHPDEALGLLDDEAVSEALVERIEAELADARLGEAYLDQHPRRVGSLARIEAARQEVERSARWSMEAMEVQVEMLVARQTALLGAMDERGLEPDMQALEGELHRGIASFEATRIMLQVEVDRYRELRDAAATERLVLALPDGVARPARHLARQLSAAAMEDVRNAQTYGDKHPTRVDAAAAITRLEEQLDAGLDLAVRTEVTRLKLVWAQQQALQERLEQLGG